MESCASLLRDQVRYLHSSYHLRANEHRRFEVKRLRNIDGAGPRQFCAEYRRDVRGGEDALRDALLERRCCGIGFIEVNGIDIARDAREVRDILGRYGVSNACLHAAGQILEIVPRPDFAFHHCLLWVSRRRGRLGRGFAFAVSKNIPVGGEWRTTFWRCERGRVIARASLPITVAQRREIASAEP